MVIDSVLGQQLPEQTSSSNSHSDSPSDSDSDSSESSSEFDFALENDNDGEEEDMEFDEDDEVEMVAYICPNHGDRNRDSDNSDDYNTDEDIVDDIIGFRDRAVPLTPDREDASHDEDTDFGDDDDSIYRDSDDSYTYAMISPYEYLKYDPTPDSQYPKPDWSTVNELRSRKFGFSSSKQIRPIYNATTFERKASSSLWMIQRLHKTKVLAEHQGCVNSLDFDTTGKLICSGGDDKFVCLWDWQSSKTLTSKIHTGHTDNIVDSLFCNSNYSLTTAARDGTVRLIDIESGETEKLLTTVLSRECRITFTSPDTIVACGLDACVYMIDFRTKETERLFRVRSFPRYPNCGLALQAITTHPLDKHQLAVAGESPFVCIYDLRFLTNEEYVEPTHSFSCIQDQEVVITSIAYNSTGDKLLINHNDDDLVVCRTDTDEIMHRYKGHRNRRTVKDCLWFGDNYVMCGSDDGYIYGWELNSEHIVCFLQGDSRIVNNLALHPTIPVLASSGIDHDVKIWEPNADTWPQTLKGIKQHICQNTMRRNVRRHHNADLEFENMEAETDIDL